MLISLDELPEALRAHVAALNACVRLALGDFSNHHEPPIRIRYSLRTEASIIHDYMVWYARDRFSWKQKRNLFLVEVAGDYLVKLKKLTGAWKTRNIQTNMVLQFEQQRQLALFDDLNFTHLFVGYQRNDVDISKSSIWIVCPNGKRIKWIAELTDVDGAVGLQVAVPQTPSTPEPEQRRIKPKIAIAEEATSEQKKDGDDE